MKTIALIETAHQTVRSGIVILAVSAAALGYPGAEHRPPVATALASSSLTADTATPPVRTAATIEGPLAALAFGTKARPPKGSRR